MNAAVVGVDLSLARTGVCAAGICDLIATTTTGMERLHRISHAVLEAAAGADLVLLEGYAMGTARQSMSYATGELGGVVRYHLWTHQVGYVDVPPATLKKFATGKGNANKDAMIATAARAGCPADDNNAVDAWWLYQLGRAHLDQWDVAHTAYRDDALGGVAWPSAVTV
jgi:Holliday junction resolvasome RuvABC endonuclease subunit